MEDWFRLDGRDFDGNYSVFRQIYQTSFFAGAYILAKTISSPCLKFQNFIGWSENKLEEIIGNKK